MAHTHDDKSFVTAYDKRTGKKLPNKVPRTHIDIFPNLSLTPKARAAEKSKPKVPDFIESKKEG